MHEWLALLNIPNLRQGIGWMAWLAIDYSPGGAGHGLLWWLDGFPADLRNGSCWLVGWACFSRLLAGYTNPASPASWEKRGDKVDFLLYECHLRKFSWWKWFTRNQLKWVSVHGCFCLDSLASLRVAYIRFHIHAHLYVLAMNECVSKGCVHNSHYK